MKKRGFQGVAICIILASLLCGCGGSAKKVIVSESEGSDKKQIGISFDSFVIERWVRDRDAFVSTAEELGAEVNVQNANGSLDEQISQIEYFISKKMDVIVVVAVDCYGLSDVIEKARKEGIRVISYDRLIQNAPLDLYISFDNQMVGQEMAQSIIDGLPEGGNIACIFGPESDNNVFLVKDGFDQTLEASGKKIQVAYTAHCDNWDADKAPKYAEEAISQVSNLKAIMCGNDDIATQVAKTLSEYRLAGKVLIVGQDADLSACQRIVEGTQTMTVFKHVEELAKAAAYFAVELAGEEEISGNTASLGYGTDKTLNNGKEDVPYFSLDPVVVNASNIDKVIIDSGFHEKSEVYLNVGS